MTPQSLDNVRAEALFASDVQFSDPLTPELVRAAVIGSVRRYGSRGCAGIVASEFGDHPEVAVPRMSWVLGAIRTIYPGHQRPPRSPGPSPLAA